MKKVFSLLTVIGLVFSLAACQQKEVEVIKEVPLESIKTEVVETEVMVPRTVFDREGNVVTIPTNIERIISTAPSNSEILLGLGLGDKIVGVDKYTSEHPDLDPNVTRFNFRQPDIEVLIALNPDIIIASGHNKIGDEDPYKLVKEVGITVVYLPSSSSIDGIFRDIQFIAEITNTVVEGNQMINEIQNVVNEVSAIAATITEKKSIYLEISPAPWIYTTGANTFQDSIINLIGATNVFADQESWVSASEEVIIAKNPDFILTTVSGDTMVDEILAREGWDVMDAISNGQVYQVDGNAMSRPSQNVVTAIKELAELIYPDLYDFE